MRSGRKKLLIGVVLVVFLLAAVVAVRIAILLLPKVYWTDESPDGRYQIVVYRIPMMMAMPGQGSDASGYILLMDSSGRVLEGTNVGMVSIVEQPEWSQDRVYIKLMADWELP